jgi:hypothetical protein
MLAYLVPGHEYNVALGLEWRAAELEGDGAPAVHQEVEPTVVARESEAFLGCTRAHADPHQAHSQGGDHATANHR